MENSERKVKQVIVVRKDLKMPKGKIGAQVAHASLGSLLKLFNKKHFPITYRDYIKSVITPTIVVSIVAFILPFISSQYMPKSFLTLLLVTLICFVSSFLSILLIGCTTEEKTYVYTVIKNKISKSL